MFCQLSRSRYHSPSPRIPTTSQRVFPSSKLLECRRQEFSNLVTITTAWLPRSLRSSQRIHLPAQETREMLARSLGGEDPLEEEMATHPMTLAWRSPCTEPSGLQSMGRKELDMTKRLSMQRSFLKAGKGVPLQPRCIRISGYGTQESGL